MARRVSASVLWLLPYCFTQRLARWFFFLSPPPCCSSQTSMEKLLGGGALSLTIMRAPKSLNKLEEICVVICRARRGGLPLRLPGTMGNALPSNQILIPAFLNFSESQSGLKTWLFPQRALLLLALPVQQNKHFVGIKNQIFGRTINNLCTQDWFNTVKTCLVP